MRKDVKVGIRSNWRS